MKRTSLVIVFVFAAGLGVGYFARGAVGMAHETDTHAADLAAIEKLHAADIRATLTQVTGVFKKGTPKGWINSRVGHDPCRTRLWSRIEIKCYRSQRSLIE